MLLILTTKKDFTADFLIVDLLKRGLPYFRMNSEDLASADYTFSIDKSGLHKAISISAKDLILEDVKSVWYRRAIHPIPDLPLSRSEINFVAGELRHLATGLVLNPKVTWVNPIDKVFLAEHKLYQLRLATKLGFHVPRTLISRDREKLKAFVGSNKNGTICKPIFHGLFFDGESHFSVYTRRVDIDSFDAASLDGCPVMLQEEIPRIADVRATFIGDQYFVADIKAEKSAVDWRRPDASAEYSHSDLSDDVVKKCRALLSELGLKYGAFDFIRTPEAELIFLEINPTGEWAWLENRLGFPMRDAFVKLFFGENE